MKKAYALFVAALLFASAGVIAETYQEGVQYVPIAPQPPVGTGDQVEVVEFFWYGCPHCKDFEPVVKKWAGGLPANVSFTQIPVMFGGPADLHAQVYYALEGMGELERMHEKFFHAMHDEKRKLRTRDEVDALLQENGVDMDKFNQAMNSFAVAAKVNRARALMRRYGIRSVPTLVMDGRYRSGSGFRSYEEMTEVVDHVVAKVLEQRKQAVQQ
ncbi:MAG: thiol:disulfide interchange protein DsbA/DsbL [Gammaproteobacteria bacterium]|nr:thiol:disulfide interchange protein DsbA/DsbL [Gammaproteobacteria bacterium]